MRADVPVRSAEGAVVGEAGGRAAGREGLQGPRHVVAIQRRNAGAAGAIRVGRAGCRRPWDIVARWGRARAARRRGDHRDRARRYIVTLVVHVATPVVNGIVAPRVVARVSSCAGGS